MLTEPVDPDCRDGKHRACPGWTLDPHTDQMIDCACACHVPGARETGDV